ncbi:hypothetical protein AVEN_264816-1 [Araneus ventricosus]|uniref:Mariner Mos1 transposase n=1 Tax=Araneus ventricosus TaxID=182803 RepID=A0A4Y2DZ95_ARAVE|nr:hypothetical protein AVEN_264816-1 [Araneus ventricosus]
MLCIWWDQEGAVYHQLLKCCETVNIARYQQQIVNFNHSLIVKRLHGVSLHGKVILLHHHHTRQKKPERVKRNCLGSINPPALFSRPCALRISLLPFDRPHTVSTALPNVQRFGPMDH